MPNTKNCGHPPNPDYDRDMEDRPYDSCYQCFMADYERVYEQLTRQEELHLKDGDDSTKSSLGPLDHGPDCKCPRCTVYQDQEE